MSLRILEPNACPKCGEAQPTPLLQDLMRMQADVFDRTGVVVNPFRGYAAGAIIWILVDIMLVALLVGLALQAAPLVKTLGLTFGALRLVRTHRQWKNFLADKDWWDRLQAGKEAEAEKAPGDDHDHS